MSGTPGARREPISASDRVSDVLARDESLVDIFVRHSTHFEKLRSARLRKVMAKLVTVEQAARVAGVSSQALVDDLNDALGLAPRAATGTASAAEATIAESTSARPTSAPVVELDVREDLRSGREPFSLIMSAVAALDREAVLHLRAIFEPAPLYAVLRKRGFEHETQCHAPDDWSVWFWRPEATAGTGATGSASATTASGESITSSGLDDVATDPSVVVLDVRDLQPPEPLVRTLAAAEQLGPGQTLVQVNLRVPQFLLPMLTEQGYSWEVDESRVDRVLVRIRPLDR